VSAALLDVNVLVALAWPTHVHHDAAHAWFSKHADEGWATCPITQCGFVRVSANPRITLGAAGPTEALAVLRGMTAHRHHQFWPADIDFTASHGLVCRPLMGHQQVTDAYLLALAVSHKGRLVTFDRGLAALLPAEYLDQHVLDVIPAA
jgi:toxin-antitoxin system PIN domain toxin